MQEASGSAPRTAREQLPDTELGVTPENLEVCPKLNKFQKEGEGKNPTAQAYYQYCGEK